MSGRKNMMILLCLISLIITPLGASALASPVKNPPEIGADTMVADFFVVRPLQLASLIMGTGVFIVSLPFSALGNNVDQAYDMMMKEPAQLLFKRPLGGF